MTPDAEILRLLDRLEAEGYPLTVETALNMLHANGHDVEIQRLRDVIANKIVNRFGG